jgi:hypothetical protein
LQHVADGGRKRHRGRFIEAVELVAREESHQRGPIEERFCREFPGVLYECGEHGSHFHGHLGVNVAGRYD